MKSEIHEFSGNIFQDLGYSHEDVELLRLRADLMIHRAFHHICQ